MAADAFLIGWTDAAHGIAAETAREVLARYPVFTADEVTLYLNGAEDGATGDRWRLDGAQIIPRPVKRTETVPCAGGCGVKLRRPAPALPFSYCRGCSGRQP